jgi:hypothetical protein
MVDQECFIPRSTMAIVPGEKAADKRLNPTAANLPFLSPAAAATEAALVGSRASFSFPSLVAGNDLNLGAFRAGDQCVEQLRCLPALKIEKERKFYSLRRWIMFQSLT